MERRRLLGAYGAELVLTPGKARACAAPSTRPKRSPTSKKYFMPQQFKNPANPRVHEETTGPEIFDALEGEVDAFVAGVGTGRHHHRRRPCPARPPTPDSHRRRGTGCLSRPLRRRPRPPQDPGDRRRLHSRRSRHRRVSGSDHGHQRRGDGHRTELAREEGIFAGISSGANVFAALQVARKLGPGKNVVTILCDTGERYLSTGIYD